MNNPTARTTLDFSTDSEPQLPRIQMAPLIDIVFLLICFFMLAAQLIQSQDDPSIELPAMDIPQARTAAPAEIIVNLRPDGTLNVNGALLIHDHLQKELRRQSAAAKSAGKPLRVVVRSDRRPRFDQLSKVLSLCKKAGLANITLRIQGSSHQ